MAPGREWRLIEINACLADIDTHRQHLLGQPSSNSPPSPWLLRLNAARCSRQGVASTSFLTPSVEFWAQLACKPLASQSGEEIGQW